MDDVAKIENEILRVQADASAELNEAIQRVKAFNAQSDQSQAALGQAFGQHVTMLLALRRSVALLDARVSQCRVRSEALAKKYDLDPATFFPEKEDESS